MKWWWWAVAAALAGIPAWGLYRLHAEVDSWQAPPAEVVFAGRTLPTQQLVDLDDGRRIFCAKVGNAAGPLVVLIHGTPGGWGDFHFIMKNDALAERALIVSVDRLGWGGSANNGLEPLLEMQAAAVAAVVEAHSDNDPAIVAGHSLGAVVAVRVATDFPDLVDGVLIVAGSIDPALEKTTWYQLVARLPGVNQLVPQALAKADEEVVPLRNELEKMLPLWSEIRCPVLVLHGEEDGLVPVANAGFAERVITGAPLVVRRIPDQGHLIPWQRPELMASSIHQMLDGLRAGPPP